jgi:hypothetical protein
VSFVTVTLTLIGTRFISRVRSGHAIGPGCKLIRREPNEAGMWAMAVVFTRSLSESRRPSSASVRSVYRLRFSSSSSFRRFALQYLQAAAALRLPRLKGRLRKAVASTGLCCRQPRLLLPEDRNDLLFRKPVLTHGVRLPNIDGLHLESRVFQRCRRCASHPPQCQQGRSEHSAAIIS